MNTRRNVTSLALTLLVATSLFAQTPSRSALSPEESAALQKAVIVIESWGKDPVIVKEVAAQNARAVTAAEVANIDKAWMAGGEAGRAATLQANTCATRLKSLVASKPGLSES